MDIQDFYKALFNFDFITAYKILDSLTPEELCANNYSWYCYEEIQGWPVPGSTLQGTLINVILDVIATINHTRRNDENSRLDYNIEKSFIKLIENILATYKELGFNDFLWVAPVHNNTRDIAKYLLEVIDYPIIADLLLERWFATSKNKDIMAYAHQIQEICKVLREELSDTKVGFSGCSNKHLKKTYNKINNLLEFMRFRCNRLVASKFYIENKEILKCHYESLREIYIEIKDMAKLINKQLNLPEFEKQVAELTRIYSDSLITNVGSLFSLPKDVFSKIVTFMFDSNLSLLAFPYSNAFLTAEQIITTAVDNSLQSIRFERLIHPELLTFIPIPTIDDDGKCLGHCLFNAVALYDGNTVQNLRNRVADEIQRDLDRYQPIIEALTTRTTREYIEAVRNNEWADNLEIAVLMRVLNRPIYIIGDNGQIINQADIDIEVDRTNPIFVHYNGHNHYNGLVNNGRLTGEQILQQILTQGQQELRPVEKTEKADNADITKDRNNDSDDERSPKRHRCT